MTRKITLFALFLLLIASIIFVTLNIEYREAISVKDFHKLEEIDEVEILGRLSMISFDSFTITDLDFPENQIFYTLENQEVLQREYVLGDILLVKGYFDDNSKDMIATEIQIIDERNAMSYLERNRPVIEITILEIIEENTLKIELENTGEVSINSNDMLDENFGYFLIYNLNDTTYSYYPFEDFGTLNPNESEIIEFTIQLDETIEENTVQFFWAKKSLYDEDFTMISSSEIIKL